MPRNATSTRRPVEDRLHDGVLVAAVHETSEARARAVVEALLEGGVSTLEISVDTPGCFRIVEGCARQSADRATLGIGGATTPEQVQRTQAAGGRFVVAPHTDPALIEAAHQAGLVAVAGALTPTEIRSAHRAGAELANVFPVDAVGGPRYVRQIRAALPDVPLWVSGALANADIEELLEAGAAVLSLGSALLADLPAAADALGRPLRDRAEQARRAAARAREGRPLLEISGPSAALTLRARDIAGLDAAHHVPLATVVPDREGQAVHLGPWLAAAGITEAMAVEVSAADGAFRREIGGGELLRGGYLHYASGGQPLGRAEGGPVRLYVRGGERGCDNVKGVQRIAMIPR